MSGISTESQLSRGQRIQRADDSDSSATGQFARIGYIDEIRGLLIFAVVFGHLVSGTFCQNADIVGVSHYLIYCVHMPMFIFISGYFSKKASSLKKIANSLLVPYVVFDIIYAVLVSVVSGQVDLNILIPTFAYWYILCLAIMRMITSFFSQKIQLALCVICVPCAAVSILLPDEVWRFLSIGRVFLLFPLYYFGYRMTEKTIDNVKKHKVILTIGVLFCVAVELALFYFGFTDHHWATHNQPGSITELILEYIMMGFSVVLFFFLCSVLSGKSKMLKRWGRNSMVIYLVHGFAVALIVRVFAFFGLSDWPLLLIALTISFVMVQILSLEILTKVYKKVFNIVRIP